MGGAPDGASDVAAADGSAPLAFPPFEVGRGVGDEGAPGDGVLGPDGLCGDGLDGGAGEVADGMRGEKDGGPGVGGLGVKGLGGACAATCQGRSAPPTSAIAKARPNGRMRPRP